MNLLLKVRFSHLLLFFVLSIGHGQENSNFIRLNQKFSGYSNIIEDKMGFIWISSNEGLYKYDGYDFNQIPYSQIFDKDFTNDKSYLLVKDNNDHIWISSYKGELTKIDTEGRIHSFKEQLTYNKKPLRVTTIKPNKSNVWLGTANGTILKHDFKTSKIDSITSLPQLNGLDQHIRDIALTDQNKLWISTNNGELLNYTLSTDKLEKINIPINHTNAEISLTIDNSGRLWVSTDLDGLFRLDQKEEYVFKQYNTLISSDTGVKHPMIISVFCDSSGFIWLGTDGDGLYRINPENDVIKNFRKEDDNHLSIGVNTINHIYEDSKGNLWIVGKKGQINILPKNNNEIDYYNGLENNAPTAVLSVFKSADGSLWIGTDGKGLNRVYPNNSKVQYNPDKKGYNNFKGKYITQLVEDKKGNIWIGTYQNGLWVFNNKTNTFSEIDISDNNENQSLDIRSIFLDSKNRIWVATVQTIKVFSDNKKLLATYDYNTHGLFGRITMGIEEDENGIIWLGLNPGRLFKFNENKKDLSKSYFTNKKYYLQQDNDTRNYNIIDLAPDHNGSLWLVCASGMLIKYDLTDGSFINYTDKESLKGHAFGAILIDQKKNLWLSSSNGIHKYNVDKDQVTSFYQIDGLQSKNYSMRSAHKDKNEVLYFGGENGVDALSPKSLSKVEVMSKLFITDIEILHKPAHLIIPNQVENGVERVTKLKLASNQSSISFKFSAIGNLLDNNYYYAYKLAGFDDEWIISREGRTASYTNIPPGNYTFEVKAGTKRGAWSITPATVNIEITPPFWKSKLAYLLYFVIGSLIIYSIILWFRLRNRLVKETWENNKKKELYDLKVNFFAKMSHEIQTPLTLILGPISDMLNRADENGNDLLKHRLLMINNNAIRLSRIANELMKFRNKEIGKLRIYASKNNLIEHLKNISHSFSEQAKFKNIEFIEEYSDSEISIWYDRDKIEHVIYNLLSNALKFTPKSGTIKLSVHNNLEKEIVEISVEDTGPGIPENELKDVFELFYQSNLGKYKKGTGIGLAFTKEMVDLHKGTIDVKSSPEIGTCFYVKLSTKENLFSDDEKVYVEDSNNLSIFMDEEYTSIEKNPKTNDAPEVKYTLLIVEDNIEMQMFLRDILEINYTLLIAANGEEGIELAEKYTPDLIISDIMMPLMDGIEMCNKIQENKQISHIPIIFLTAKNNTKTKLEGLSAGAIEYLEKPFNYHELLLKVRNTLDSKEKMLFKHKTDIISSPNDTNDPSLDHIFLKNLVNEINSQIENPDFKLEDLTKVLNMSYSSIYRKYLDITGEKLISLVRSLRLKRAALYILKEQHNISESAYVVGYKDPKHFTKSFKEEFGVPPAAFKKEAKKYGREKVIKKYKIINTDGTP